MKDLAQFENYDKKIAQYTYQFAQNLPMSSLFMIRDIQTKMYKGVLNCSKLRLAFKTNIKFNSQRAFRFKSSISKEVTCGVVL